MPLLDRCLMGFLFSILVLAILVGPLILFSPMAGFIATNAVQKTEFSVNFLISNKISHNQMRQYVSGNMNAIEDYDSLNLNAIQDGTKSKSKKLTPI